MRILHTMIRGGMIIRDTEPMNAGTTLIASVEDPDGYAIELLGYRQPNKRRPHH